jgi:hypothetical protein
VRSDLALLRRACRGTARTERRRTPTSPLLAKAQAKLGEAGDEDRTELVDIMGAVADCKERADVTGWSRRAGSSAPAVLSRNVTHDALSHLPRRAQRRRHLPPLPH